jgi:hypothetical protein
MASDVGALLAILLPNRVDSPDTRRALALELRAAADAIAAAAGEGEGVTDLDAGRGGGGDGGVPGGLTGGGSGDGKREPEAEAVSGGRSAGETGDSSTAPNTVASSSMSTSKENPREKAGTPCVGGGDPKHMPADGGKKSKPYNTKKPPKAIKAFDFSRYPQRHVALHVMYAGWAYHGFASQGAETSGVPTVEAALFHALRKTRLIAPNASWQTCDYTRCGRTDAGVSALGQVISLRVRSKVPWQAGAAGAGGGGAVEVGEGDDSTEAEEGASYKYDPDDATSTIPGDGDGDGDVYVIRDVGEGYVRRARRETKPAPPPPPLGVEELDYPAVMNRALPDDIRVLGWSYVDKEFSSAGCALNSSLPPITLPLPHPLPRTTTLAHLSLHQPSLNMGRSLGL